MQNIVKIGFSRSPLTAALDPSLPIREPIEAVAMYVEQDGLGAVWVTLDYMDFNRLVTDTLRSAVVAETGIPHEHIHILTTHNHGAGYPDAKALAPLIATLADKAVKNAQPALMRFASTKATKQVNIIRRLYIPEIQGVSTLYFGACEQNDFNSALFAEKVIDSLKQGRECNSIGNSTSRGNIPFQQGDTELWAVEFCSLQGAPIGSLIRFAAHAVCANRPDSFSSDYPYYVRRGVETSLGGVCMFLNGPCAEIAPAMLDKMEGREKVLGSYLADLAISALKKENFGQISKFDDAKYEIKLPVRLEMLEGAEEPQKPDGDDLPTMRRYTEKLRLFKTMDFLQEKYSSGESSTSDMISVFLGVLRLGELVIAAFPGETFYATGEAVKQSFGNLKLFTVTEHERTVMYLPPLEDFLLGGYESVCKLTAPDAEAVLRNEAILALKSFTDCKRS